MKYQKLIRANIVFLLLLIASCDRPESSAQVLPTSSPSHQIGIKVEDGEGEFYDRLSGEKFTPRGNNYVRLANMVFTNGETIFYHSTFNVGLYDPTLAENALQTMDSNGYNVVRVFLTGNCKNDCIGDSDGKLSKGYVANVVDFLRKAEKCGIYVIFTTDSEPATQYYNDFLNSSSNGNFGGTNLNYLTSGGISVAKEFWKDFIEELLAQNAPMNAIFAYELRNEFFFETDANPLAMTSGVVQTANGKSYDMSSEEEKQRMMDENSVFWLDEVSAAIREVDPTALVAVGFFPPDEPNSYPLGNRHIRTYAAIWESKLDFIDLHPYPFGYSLGELVENFEMDGMREKPIIMGEFGAFSSFYVTEMEAAQGLHDWQIDSCNYDFDGWILWTWDTDEQPELFNGLDGDGFINEVLSPVNRPDPCTEGDFDFFEANLALGMITTASRSGAENPASFAVDGRNDQWWLANDFAPQWVQIDLGNPSTIDLIRLVTVQSPAGLTIHQIWVGAVSNDLYLLHKFEGDTVDSQVLEFDPENPIENVRYIKIVTTQSPSWVGWREIEIIEQ